MTDDVLPLPSGVVVQVKVPSPPTIIAPTPEPSAVLVVPTPGPPGLTELLPEQFEEIVTEVEEGLEPPINLVVLFENNLA